MCNVTMFGKNLEAAILDLDGVITRTASVHAHAWKAMFDDYLRRRAGRSEENPRLFSIDGDYRKYVDGKPRYEGAQSFLESRNIDLPWGDPNDEPGTETVCGLGNQKNAVFHRLLNEEGVEVFEDAVHSLKQWRQQGMKTALVSSSKNCKPVMEAAGIAALFDAVVDGREAEREQIPGKPEPDVFLRAAEKIDVRPADAAVFEDATAGVEAGRRGGFGLVVGVARNQPREPLRQGGADVVIGSFDEISQDLVEREETPKRPPSALEHFPQLRKRWTARRPAVFLDYDGTLTPIVSRPEDATMSDPMRRVVRHLAGLTTVAIVSGRDRSDVENMVGLPDLVYAGSHGYDIRGPSIRREHEGGLAALPELDAVEEAARRELAGIEGVHIERKRFAVAVHYRNVAHRENEQIRQAVETLARQHPELRLRGGKKIFELQPDIDWDKGKAILWLLEVLGLDLQDTVPLYLGDDVTDEDAFSAIEKWGVGVVVGDETLPSRAHFWLAEPDEVRRFLNMLISLLERSTT